MGGRSFNSLHKVLISFINYRMKRSNIKIAPSAGVSQGSQSGSSTPDMEVCGHRGNESSDSGGKLP